MKNLFCSLTISLLLITAVADAQFFQGFGATIGVTKAKQKWFYPTKPDASGNTRDSIAVRKKNVIGFNGSLRAEFINSDYIRWVTELQFNQKGCKEKPDSVKFKNKLNYICWNNFLKLQYETFEGFPYILFGPRVEYLISKKIQSPSLNGDFKKFNFSLSVGVGFEKIVYSNFKPFVELHYNPDTWFYYGYEHPPMNARDRAWELRIGLIYRPGKKDCPGVIY